MSATLESWARNRWLRPHDPSPQEIRDLVLAARGDLDDAAKDLSPAWRLAIAYTAALRLCTAALMACGYRAERDQKRYRTIASLPLTVGSEAGEVAGFLDACRTRRHEVTYEGVTTVSESEADELLRAVHELDVLVTQWLDREHPGWRE